MSTQPATYDSDLYTWSLEQAELLRQGKFDQADLKHIIEEIEDMSKSEKRALQSFLENLLMHLLKWVHQPGLRGNSWKYTVIEQRKRLHNHLRENPGLKGKLDESIKDAYSLARLSAARETGLSDKLFPEICPWTFETFTNPEFWPPAEDEADYQ